MLVLVLVSSSKERQLALYPKIIKQVELSSKLQARVRIASDGD